MVVPADQELSFNIVYMLGGIATGTAFLTWFIADQFSRNRRLIYRVVSRHNKEDDDRFQVLSDEIWEIRLRNAQRDGDAPPPRRTLPRRRYLIEDNGAQSDLDAEPAAV